MILAHREIHRFINEGSIKVEPFNPAMVGTNSLDVTLGDHLKIVEYNAWDSFGHGYIDPELPQRFNKIMIPEAGLILQPDLNYLGFTVEVVGSDDFVPIYEGRSSVGRMFLFSHVCAGFGDLGFKQQWTLEIFCRMRIRVKPGMKLGQIFFQTASSNDYLYGREIKGRYANQSGPQESRYGEA